MELLDLITGEVVNEKFARNFTTPVKDEGEPGDPRTITEMAYVPPVAQIKDMLAAGERLAAARRARFSPQTEMTDEDAQEVGITQGMDLVDVQRAAEALSERLAERVSKAAAEAAKAKEDEDAKAFEAAVQARAAELAKASAVKA